MTKTVILLTFAMPNFAYAAYIGPLPDTNPIFAPKNPSIFVTPDVFGNYKYLTFTPDTKVIGPVFGDGSLQDYYALIFRHLIQQADAKIHDNPHWGYQYGSNKNFTYYAFLVLALTIVQQESRGIHLRQSAGLYCNQNTNSLDDFWRGVRSVLLPIYRDPLRPLIPDCRYIKNAPVVDQMITLSPTGDLGIMQMNALYHPDAMDPAILMNVYRSIDAGVDYIWSGFEKLRNKLMAPKQKWSATMNCIKPFDPFHYRASPTSPVISKPAIWASLDIASWSHEYNGQKLCSQSRTNKQFYNNLLSIVRDDSSVWHKYLPEGTLERAALDEIVANFRAAFSRRPIAEQNSALEKILNYPGTLYGSWKMPARTLIGPTHFLRQGKIPVYYGPVAEPQYSCGYLSSDGNGKEQVKVYQIFIDQNGRAWGAIELPKYVSFAHIGATQMVKFKKGVQSVYVRKSPSIEPSTVMRIVHRNGSGQSPQFRLIKVATVAGRQWDQVIDDSNTVAYVAASYFQTFYNTNAPVGICNGNDFFVPMSDLKKLPPSFNSGKSYLGFVIGKGQLQLLTMPNAYSMASPYTFAPGTVVTVLKSAKGNSGRYWDKITKDTSSSNTYWVRAERIQKL